MRRLQTVPLFIRHALDGMLRASLAGSIVVAVVSGGSAAYAYAVGYRVNTTASMPVGLWHITPYAEYKRGQVVWVCPPQTAVFREARRYGFVPHGFCPGGFNPLLKPVAAVAGDRVDVADSGITVNGRFLANSAPARVDAKGRFLPRVPRRVFSVRPGEIWLISSYNAASFDSRYFGPVSTALVAGVADPVATKDAY